MKNYLSLSPFSRLRPISPGWETIESLLELYPQAGVLVDFSDQRILAVNAGMAKLTAYTRGELKGLRLPDLILSGSPELPMLKPLESTDDQEAGPITLRQRSDTTGIEVFIKLKALDAQGRSGLLLIETVFDRMKRLEEQKRQATLWKNLPLVAAAPLLENPQQAVEATLKAGSELTNALLLAVYTVSSEGYILHRQAVWGPEEFLPDKLPIQEISGHVAPALWVKNNRANTRLQKAARAANLAYLGTAPLGERPAVIGVLAVAGESAPPEHLLDHLRILSSTLGTILQNQVLSGVAIADKQRMRQQEALQVAIARNITEGVVILTPEGLVLDMNPPAEAALGYSLSDVAGQPYHHLIVGPENVIPPFIDPESGNILHDLGNATLFRRDGSTFLAHLRTLPVLAGEELCSLLVLIQDLTSQEQFREKSQHLEQLAFLGEITAAFAHEVRNPINNITTGLDVIADTLPKEDPIQENVNRMKSDCDRVEEQLKRVLNFSRTVEYKIEPFDLVASLRKTIERFRMQMTRANIQANLQVDPDTPQVEGDVRALEQVWTNLVGNAIDAMAPSGSGNLTVKIRPVIAPDGSARVEVSVTDSGPGISEEIRLRIFDTFFTTKQHGTGLGLAIVKQIVTLHKGSIQVVSIPGGTSFQVQIPVARGAHYHANQNSEVI